MRSALFRKYVVLFAAVIGTALVANNLVNIWFTYGEYHDDTVRFQKEQAAAAASKISQFIKEIEGQLGWMTHLSWATQTAEQRELDALRLLRQVPAITELALLDDKGREQLRFSRQAEDRVGSGIDYSADDRFKVALANKVYYGHVYFRRETEPYMTLAVAGARRDAGVTVAEVNLKHIWDVVSQIRVGRTGHAYVVDSQGRLLAHPDISLVLRKTDLSHLSQVKSARAALERKVDEPPQTALNLRGERVVSAFAPADPLKWLVFVELPEGEANAPLYGALTRSVVVLLAGLLLAFLMAVLLARRMAVPIQALTSGAARIGTGALDHRIAITTGDELEALGDQFNHMASQLQSSYATLERKVDERTHQLQLANLSKSRFLAAASHDLRQPLHALNLFVAQLRSETDPAERNRLAARIEAAIDNMNGLFNGLLDISKLDCRRHEAEHLRFSHRQHPEAHGEHVRRHGPRKRAQPARRAEPCLGAQRRDPAGADPAQSRLQRRALYADRWRSRGMPPQGRQAAHRRMRHRQRHCGGPAAQHIQRVLPTRSQGEGRAGWAGIGPCNRGTLRRASRSSDWS